MEFQESKKNKERSPAFQKYYDDKYDDQDEDKDNVNEWEDYEYVLGELPIIIDHIVKHNALTMEPTLEEQTQVRNVINNYIKTNKRKIYGGTAVNEAIRLKNPELCIYCDYTQGDIEFYSSTPRVDIVELANLLHQKGFKDVVASAAMHDGTYSLFVNLQLYCDVTYVPKRIYFGIKTFEVDGISYVDPSFIRIDQLRIINQPLTAAEQRWEKTFKRFYLLQKYYPFEFFDKPLNIPKPDKEISSYMEKIRSEFMLMDNITQNCLISGYEAFNFYVRYSCRRKGDSRIYYDKEGIVKKSTNLNYFDIITVNYKDNVIAMYNFLKKIVNDPTKLTFEEYFPFFQFTDKMTIFLYDGKPICSLTRADGFAIPYVSDRRNVNYVSFQYLLMVMLINRFRSFLSKNKDEYFNYSTAVSNLVTIRHDYLVENNLEPINKSLISDFAYKCIGKTMPFIREYRLKMKENNKKGKQSFRYTPEFFFSQPKESQDKFDPSRELYPNTSGNNIFKPEQMTFKINEYGDMVYNDVSEEEEALANRIKARRIRKVNSGSSDDGASGVINDINVPVDDIYQRVTLDE